MLQLRSGNIGAHTGNESARSVMTEFQFDFQHKRAERELEGHQSARQAPQAGVPSEPEGIAETRAMSPIDDELNGVWQTRPMPTERVLPDQPTVPVVHDFAQTQSLPPVAVPPDEEATQAIPVQTVPVRLPVGDAATQPIAPVSPANAATDDSAPTQAMPTRALPPVTSPDPMPTRPIPVQSSPQSACPPRPAYPPSHPAAAPMSPVPSESSEYPMPEPAVPARAAAKPRRCNWFLRGGKHGFLSFWLWVVTAALAALMSIRVIPGLDMDGRALPELIAFLPVAGLVSAAIAVLAFWWRRWLLTAVSVVCVALQLSWHMGYFVPAAQLSDEARSAVAAESVASDDAYARIMTLNAREGKADAASIVALVQREHVEVLALQEVNDDLLQRLKDVGISKLLPHRVVGESGANDNGGVNVLYTKAAMSRPDSNLLTIDTSAMPAGTVTMGGKQVRFVSAHPNSPTRGKQDLWGAGLGTIGSLKEYDWTYVVMGDFNSTWDHPRFRELLGDRFVDASEQAGRGYHFTYPANVEVHGVTVPSVIEIDHIIHDRGVTMGDLETVTVPGSDHKALLATMQVR